MRKLIYFICLAALFCNINVGNTQGARLQATINTVGSIATVSVRATNNATSTNAASGCVINVGIGLPKIGLEAAPAISITSLIGGTLSAISVEEITVNGSPYWAYGAVIDGAGFASVLANEIRDIYRVSFPATTNGRFPRAMHSENTLNIVEFDLFFPSPNAAPFINSTTRFFTGGAIDLDNADGETWVESFAPLPISLETFSATKHNERASRLNWTTSSEINSDFFGIERSKDGNNWETIGRVTAAGNSSKELAYEFIDDNLPLIRTKEQVFYYRLRMTDLDGQYKYSDVRGVNFGKLSTGVVTIYPNPTVEHINVDLSGMDLDAGKVDLFVYDMTGRQVIKKSIIGNGIELVDVSQLPANTYNVVVKQGETAYQQRVIKID